MGAFAAVVYSMDGLAHWESDAQSSALANTGLSTLAGTSWQQFPSWWSGMEPSTADVYYKMRDTSGVCEERPMCQPIGAEFGLVCSCSMTPNVQVPSSAQCDNESKQQEREEQGVQSRIDAEPDVSDKFRCSLSHSSNWKNTFVHLMAPLATMHGAQRRSRSVPKDFGSSKADWNTTYQAFRFVRASRPEQQSSAKMSICKVSSGALETHVTFDQFATEFHRHAEEKPPARTAGVIVVGKGTRLRGNVAPNRLLAELISGGKDVAVTLGSLQLRHLQPRMVPGRRTTAGAAGTMLAINQAHGMAGNRRVTGGCAELPDHGGEGWTARAHLVVQFGAWR